MEVQAIKGKAVVRLDPKADIPLSTGSIYVARGFGNKKEMYHQQFDFETGTVVSLGEGDFEPVEVGDRVIVRAISGGVAGADISKDLGEPRNSVIVVLRDEIVAKIGD